MADKWTNEEIEYLKNNIDNMSCKDIAEKLNRTVRAIQHKFGNLGLKHKTYVVGDIVDNNWKIIDIKLESKGSQKLNIAILKSTINSLIIERSLYRLNSGIKIRNIHNAYNSRIYSIWSAMRRRCNIKNAQQYKRYAGRGITVCCDWNDFRKFEIWAVENGYSEELSLDRIDVNGNYEPNNCRWITIAEQNDNKSTVDNFNITAWGETKGIFNWLRDERCNTTLASLKYRILKKWPPEEAISKKSMKVSKKEFTAWIKKYKPEIYQEYLEYKNTL